MASLRQIGMSAGGIIGAVSGSVEGGSGHIAFAPHEESPLITMQDGKVLVHIDPLQQPPTQTEESRRPTLEFLFTKAVEVLFEEGGSFQQDNPGAHILTHSQRYRYNLSITDSEHHTAYDLNHDSSIVLELSDGRKVAFFQDMQMYTVPNYPDEITVALPNYVGLDTDGDGTYDVVNHFTQVAPQYPPQWVPAQIEGQEVYLAGQTLSLEDIFNDPSLHNRGVVGVMYLVQPLWDSGTQSYSFDLVTAWWSNTSNVDVGKLSYSEIAGIQNRLFENSMR